MKIIALGDIKAMGKDSWQQTQMLPTAVLLTLIKHIESNKKTNAERGLNVLKCAEFHHDSELSRGSEL